MNLASVWRFVITVLFGTCVAACGAPPDVPSVAAAEDSNGVDHGPWASLSTFAGTVPCASCPGIEMTLQLKPDGTFFLRSTYLEAENAESRTVNDIGRWALTPNEEMLVVRDGSTLGRRFSVVDPDTLRMLDTRGEPIESDFSYVLVRTHQNEVLSGPLRLEGMYRYLADAALFESCRTRLRYPVVFEEDHVDLERAYLAANKEPGSPMMASFVGRIELRPRMEGGGEREFVVVSDFIGVNPGERCYDEEVPLARTIWRLVELNGKPFSRVDSTRMPHLVLIPDDRRAAGSGGCNRFTGSYEMSGDSLRFHQLALTSMDCPGGVDLERAFMEALEAVSTLDHFGETLELWSDHRLRARLRAASDIEY